MSNPANIINIPTIDSCTMVGSEKLSIINVPQLFLKFSLQYNKHALSTIFYKETKIFSHYFNVEFN